MVGGWSRCALACVAPLLLPRAVESAVTCWGQNKYGNLAVPQSLGPVVQLSAGRFHTCARTANGAVSCWGLNDAGQSIVPATLGSVAGVSAGGYHTCARTSGGAVSCWGCGLEDHGQCKEPSGLAPVAELAAGGWHTCARTTSGAVTCWGAHHDGQCDVPNDLGSVAELVAGDAHTCARATNGAVRCWGLTSNGRCNVPSGLGTVVQLVAGAGHTCALAASGTVTCWGHNGEGQCTVPGSLDPVEELAAGHAHTCARLASGAIRCWGYNGDGRCTVPAGLGHVAELAAGRDYTCARTRTLPEWLDMFSSAAETAQVSIYHDGRGVVSLGAKLPDLPAAGELQGGASLAYSADLQPTAAALTWNSSCSSLWHLRKRSLEASLPYEGLRSGPCAVSEELRDSSRVCTGYVGLFVRVTSDGDRVVKDVHIAVKFWLPLHTPAIQPVTAMPRTSVVQPDVRLSPWASRLQLFEAGFARARKAPAVTAGETVFVQQSVEGAGHVELSLVSVWLSASPDPANAATARTNLSAAPSLLPAPASSIRFSVSIQACPNCYIHVISAMRDERGAGVQASSQVHSTTTPTDELQGSFDIEVSSSTESFMASPRVQGAVVAAVRALGVLPASARVNVGLTPMAAGHGVPKVRAAYSITVPIAGLPNGRSAHDIVASLRSATVTRFNDVLWAMVGFAAVGVESHELSVVSSAPPLHQ